jgi:hypothetical protein
VSSFFYSSLLWLASSNPSLGISISAAEVDCSLDSTDGTVTLMGKVLHTMTQAVLMSPNFQAYEDISPPFGLLLFYLFNFIVSVCIPSSHVIDIVLLNILVALFNQAYAVVTDNAVDEFLALFSHKTLNFIRAPDENTFCAPLNLIEIFFIIPLQPFLKPSSYQKFNEIVMRLVYFPVLVIIAFYESKLVPNDILIIESKQRRLQRIS